MFMLIVNAPWWVRTKTAVSPTIDMTTMVTSRHDPPDVTITA